MARILKLQLCMASALKVDSEEARRDWCKLCTLERKFLEESGRKFWEEMRVPKISIDLKAC